MEGTYHLLLFCRVSVERLAVGWLGELLVGALTFLAL